MAESLILSDGTRTYDFLAASAAIYVAPDGLNLPVVSRENTYAEGSDSEGRSRIRSRAVNSEAGSLTLYFRASTAATFWDAVDNLQELVESAHLNKGTLAYTKYGSSNSVTFDLESIQVTGLPVKGTESAQRHTEATISFESKPYGRLDPVQLPVQSNQSDTLVGLGSMGIILPLGSSSGLTDLSGNGRNGTAQGGVTVGGYSPGPLTLSDGGATDFDGTNDRISTTYTTRRNLCTNPNFETNTTGWGTTGSYRINSGASLAQSTTSPVYDTNSMRIITAAGTAFQGADMTGISVVSGVTYTFSVYMTGAAGIFELLVGDGAVGAATGTSQTMNGTTKRLTVTFTASGTGSTGFSIRQNEPGNPARTVYVDGALIEAASSAGTYFPTVAQLSAGQAGWLGTANNSASDIGCFANGTTRTFMGWSYRDAGGASHTLIGGSNNGFNGICLRINATSGVDFFPTDASAATNWAAAWPGSTQWVHWALVFDEPNNNASLYINGALVSTQTQTAQFAPGSSLEVGSWAASQFFDGKQSWVAVREGMLTATQIRDVYDSGKARISLDGPIDYFTVSGVTGQVPALPVIALDDDSAKARNIVEVGVQNKFNPASPEALLLNLELGLTAQAGSSTTRAGSVSTNICRAALTTSAVSVCKAASLTHKGLWKIRTRVYPSATTVLVRLAWRAGDGPFAKEKWVQVPNSAGWYDLDLGTVNIKELPSGHTCEFRIEAKCTSGVPTVDVDIVECIPADCYTKLRGSTQIDTPSAAIVAVDDFSTQTAGAVTGKTPLLAPAGLWSGAGDADDFTVDSTNKWITRYAFSDSALNNGRYLRCGSGTLAATTVSADVRVAAYGGVVTDRFGVMLRYVDTSNWLMCVYSNSGFGPQVSLIKRVAGAETTLAATTVPSATGWRTLTIGADTLGNVLVYECAQGGVPAPIILTLADSSLATAGALASGGYGLYDATTSASYDYRYYDNFTVSTLATSASIVNPAINSGYGLDLKHNTALTDNSTGTSTGTTPIRQGNYPKLPPATRNGTKSRIVVRARRDDNDLGLADSGTSDVLRATLTVTPRVHLTGT